MEIKNWGRTCPRKKNFDPAVEIRDGKQPKQQRKLVEKKLEKKLEKNSIDSVDNEVSLGPSLYSDFCGKPVKRVFGLNYRNHQPIIAIQLMLRAGPGKKTWWKLSVK